MRFGYLAIVAAFAASVCAAPVAVANAGLEKRVPTVDGTDMPSLWKRQAEPDGPGANPGKPWKRDGDDVEAAGGGLSGPGKGWKRQDDSDDVSAAGLGTGPGKAWKRHIKAEQS